MTAPSSIDRRIGANIRSARLGAGMTQDTLANACGVTFQQVQKYEKGLNRVSAAAIWQISKAIGVPVGTFFNGLGASRGPH